MQEIEFSCISCRGVLSASKSEVGELVQCPSCNHTMKVPRYGVVAGMKLGDFKILKCLGVGGMGEVWLAEQESLQRRVALKILSPDISNDESFINRFNQEVKIAGKLIHPNIVVAFQAGEHNGIRYLTSAYVDGLVASEELEMNGPIDEANVLRIGRDIAKGLKYAWEKAHILHRDVKPDNIMLAKDGTPMLMDMGISKNFDEDVSLTMTGEILGTPNYISPEQAHAEENIDFRSDQYSLGATLFHLLTGFLPYNATSAMGILAQHLQGPVPDPTKHRPEISKNCSKMIQKMMAKKPEERFQSWDEFISYANLLLPPEMREGTILQGTLSVPRTSNKQAMIIGTLTAVIVVSLILSAFFVKKRINRLEKNNSDKMITLNNSNLKRPDNIKKANDIPPDKNKPKLIDTPPPEPIETGNIATTNPDTLKERLKARMKNRLMLKIQELFSLPETNADKVVAAMIQFHLNLQTIVNSDLSPDEKNEKREQFKTELKNNVIREIGKDNWPKFDQFIKNHILRKPKNGFRNLKKRR